jgi:hypothetical protein
MPEFDVEPAAARWNHEELRGCMQNDICSLIQFGDKNLANWPFRAAVADFVDSRFYAINDDKAKTLADFETALELTSEQRFIQDINRNLQKQRKALNE